MSTVVAVAAAVVSIDVVIVVVAAVDLVVAVAAAVHVVLGSRNNTTWSQEVPTVGGRDDQAGYLSVNLASADPSASPRSPGLPTEWPAWW